LHHYYHGDPTTSYKPKDIDLTTNLSEEEILDRLRSPQAVNMGITVKEKESVDTFGVVFATVNHENYEIAPFRKDIGTSDGRRPDRVERGTIHDDAMRRDLTINNLYYDFDNKVILDFNPDGQGLQDIKNGVARPVGDPHERFNEDKLRVLRLVRFFSRFNPGSIKEKLDPKTASAIEQFKNLKSHGITVERIESEFTGGVKQAMNTASYIKNLYELGLLPQVFPNLKVDISGIDKIGNSKNIKVILAWLLRDNANVANVLNKLKYPAEIFDSVQFLINAMNFTPNEIFGIIRNRDKKLLKPNAVGIGGVPLSQEEINQHNLAKTASMQKDLNELSKLVDNPIIARRLNHLVTYQAPVVSGDDLKKQGFKDEQIGKKQKELTTAHYQQSFNDFRK
jgi:tRNA nucleotidyltransferase/poly(A) polymerase